MSRRTLKNVGVIGLGIIGSRIADHLRRRGFHVFVWNRTPRPFPNFVGARSEVAELCDFIQIFVADDDALLETVEQLKRSLKPHHIVMAHCTVAPHTMRAAAEIVQRRGAQLLDVPFTGSKLAAEKGELVYYVGGDAAALQRARPVLEASSKEIIEMGEIGHATTVKLATNLITATTVQATAEAMALVARAGLPPEKFATAMRGNASQSATMAMKLPKMLEGDFEPHFSIKHMLKDVQIASRMARSHGLELGAMEAARASLRREVEEGYGDLDYCAVVRPFFPEGVKPQQPESEDSPEEQQTLGGLDEAAEPVAKKPDEVEEARGDDESSRTKNSETAPKERSETTTNDEAENTIAHAAPEASDEVQSSVPADEHAREASADVVKEARGDVPLTVRAADEALPRMFEIEDEPDGGVVIEAEALVSAESDGGEGEGDEPEEKEPIVAAPAEAAVAVSSSDEPVKDESDARRSFFSRMFGKSGD